MCHHEYGQKKKQNKDNPEKHKGAIQEGERSNVTLLDLCVSSLRRGHANLLCIVPILSDDPQRESILAQGQSEAQRGSKLYNTIVEVPVKLNLK